MLLYSCLYPSFLYFVWLLLLSLLWEKNASLYQLKLNYWERILHNFIHLLSVWIEKEPSCSSLLLNFKKKKIKKYNEIAQKKSVGKS